MILATLCFSLLASLLVATLGRREPRLSAAALLLLLAMPLLACLPKWPVLPGGDGTEAGGSLLFPGLWSAGAILVTSRLIVSAVVLRRWRRASPLIETLTLPDGRSAELLLCEQIHGPVAAGVFRSTVFVPAAWTTWSGEIRNIVLAHELAHLHRRDPMWRLLGTLACAIHWFNPLVWWLARRHRLEAEFACDASVVCSGIPAKRYANVLCDLAATGSAPAGALAMAEESLLHRRVKRVFQPASAASPLVTALLLATFGLAAVAVSVIGPEKRLSPPSTEEVRLRLSADPFPEN